MRRNQRVTFGTLGKFPGFATGRAVVCVTALVMAGCAAQTPSIETDAEEPSHAPNLNLQPESLGRSLSLSQIVTGIYGDQTRSVRFEVEVEANSLVVVGLSHFGETLFLLRQEGANVAVEAYGGAFDGISPNWMQFDLQVTYWPAKHLGPALSEQRMRLEDKPEIGVRRIYGCRGEILMEVRYLDGFLVPGKIAISHFDRPYQLMIDKIE